MTADRRKSSISVRSLNALPSGIHSIKKPCGRIYLRIHISIAAGTTRLKIIGTYPEAADRPSRCSAFTRKKYRLLRIAPHQDDQFGLYPGFLWRRLLHGSFLLWKSGRRSSHNLCCKDSAIGKLKGKNLQDVVNIKINAGAFMEMRLIPAFYRDLDRLVSILHTRLCSYWMAIKALPPAP